MVMKKSALMYKLDKMLVTSRELVDCLEEMKKACDFCFEADAIISREDISELDLPFSDAIIDLVFDSLFPKEC